MAVSCCPVGASAAGVAAARLEWLVWVAWGKVTAQKYRNLALLYFWAVTATVGLSLGCGLDN